MTIYKFTFQPTIGGRDDGPVQVLATGTLDECRTAWTATVRGFYQDWEKCPTIGLMHDKGHRYCYHHGGKGSYSISLAPELIANPTYEVRPAVDRDGWLPAGHTIKHAETVMRNMAGASRLLILRNNFNDSQYVYQANSLGYLDALGTYESFYGSPR